MLEKLRWTVVGPLALAATTALATAPSAPTKCVFDEAAEWVQVNHDNLPSTLSELRKFSQAYRATILRHVGPKVEASIWAEHFDEIIARPSLTVAQRTYLISVRDSLPVWFALTADLQRARFSANDLIAQKVLGKDLTYETFVQLAPAPSLAESRFAEAGVRAGLKALAVAPLKSLLASSKLPWPDCNCTWATILPGQSNGCSGSNTCQWGPSFDCNYSGRGCGTGGVYSCDGRCDAGAET